MKRNEEIDRIESGSEIYFSAYSHQICLSVNLLKVKIKLLLKQF